MSETVKTKGNRAVKDLDTALTIIEQADIDLEAARGAATSLPSKSVITEYDLFNTTGNRIVIWSFSTAAAGMIANMAGLIGTEAFFVPLTAGLVGTFALPLVPTKLGKLLAPKKYKTYELQTVQNPLFLDIGKELFEAKEQEVLEQTKEAMYVANLALKSQDQDIVYSREEGFVIRSLDPKPINKWDEVRLRAIRTNGVKALGTKVSQTKKLSV